VPGPARPPSEYVIEHASRSLACDPRVGALDIAIEVEGDRIVALGRIETDDRRLAVTQVLREQFPGWRVDNLVLVASRRDEGTSSEEIG
jgi:hypothetical protein